ncbi:TonB family protein [Acetobacteraceae bacterium KSS8]|uniref:TonB family protein n=1 Tax=Endosaccharibacter trunci TaxID=2812733 RepID=A0ABT1W840_9PROT|nr:TonB family protein [Acetobacteraceae bacterium KSS8]
MQAVPGNCVEFCFKPMADRSVSLPATMRVPIARRPGRGEIAFEPAPAMRPADTRSGPVRRPVGPAVRASLPAAGFPLLRRTRLNRTRLERMLGGSAVAHVLLIVGLAVLFARQERMQPPQEQTPVQMIYGSSGMMGENSPDQGGGAKPQQQAAKAPAEPEVNTELPDVPPPVSLPELPDATLPPPQPAEHQSARIPLRTAQQKRARSNPFANPMDLSFQQEGPPRARTGRAGGSGSAIDMSLGPLVKNGHINTPFATIGVQGVSSDYGNELDSWIRRHLYYPPDAAARGESGPAHVHVQIDRSGRVKSVQLVDSSGSFALDGATTGMFRGRTLPPVPPDMSGDHFDIDLTVNYILEH